MLQYFTLQHTLISRHINEFGLHPIIGQILGILAFIGLSFFLFYKTSFAQYVYLLMAISALLNLSERNRNDFLKTCFNQHDYPKIRLAENMAMSLPFIAFLVFNHCYLAAGALAVAGISLAMVNLGFSGGFTIPTPFFKWPYEFTVGFRKTFILHLAAYILTAIGIGVANFNLGIFSLLLVFVVCLSYYSEVEAEYYAWIHRFKPKPFLRHKIIIALIYASILSLPISVALCIFQPDKAAIILAVQGLGYIYLSVFVLAKYAAFPHQISLPQSIILAVCFAMPPLLLLAIPMFYRQSIRKLQQILA